MVLWVSFVLITGFLLSLTSPFTAALALAGASLLTGLILAQMHFTWMFFTIIILFVGGMMVLFMYICSLTASLKIETGTFVIFVGLVVTAFLIGLASGKVTLLTKFFSSNLSSLYQPSGVLLVLLLVVYLVVGLLAAIQIASKFEGPLKDKLSNEA